ncbi:MAG: hypothetical protein HY975_00195, partial [Candidatus Kerfeldbacteria bacterium]|nr:hypothetical protein [Candidatus Kerfeldbacteria bacterium]
MAKPTRLPAPKTLLTATATTTQVTTAVGYGLISLAAASGFFFFSSGLQPLTNRQGSTVTAARPSLEEQTSNIVTLQESYVGMTTTTIQQALALRKTEMIRRMQADPDRAARNVIAPDVRSRFAAADQPMIEQQQALRGTYQPQLAELGDGTQQTIHRLKQVDGSVRFLHFSGSPVDLPPGAAVTVEQAYVLDAEALVSSTLNDGSSNLTVDSTAVTTTTTNRKTAVVLFNFSDDPRAAMTTDQVRTALFTGGSSVDAYYKEATYNSIQFVGKSRVDGDVLGWFTIPSTYPKTPSDCAGTAVDTWAAQARQLAQAAGNDLSGYDHYLYIMPWMANQWSACSWAGLADIGGNQAWINGAPNYVNVRIVGHELGHNLGLWHAQVRRCRDGSGATVSLSTSCTNTDYADTFDVMGNDPFLHRQFNTFNKSKLGLYGTSNVVDVTANGTYTVVPIEQASSGVQALRISRGPNQPPLYVEFRQPYGTFDNFALTDPAVNGVMVRLGPASGTSSAFTYLLDMTPATGDTPGTTDGFRDAALPAGQTFQDFGSGVIIKTQSVAATGAVVEVQFVAPTCQHSAPIVNLLPASQTSAPGGTKNFTFTVASTELSTCPNVTYRLNGTLPNGWTQTVTPATLSIAPGASGQFIAAVTNTASSLIGTYPVVEELIDSTTNGVVVTKTAAMSLIASEIIAPTATFTS